MAAEDVCVSYKELVTTREIKQLCTVHRSQTRSVIWAFLILDEGRSIRTFIFRRSWNSQRVHRIESLTCCDERSVYSTSIAQEFMLVEPITLTGGTCNDKVR
jgi:hypothetical protein